MSVGYDQKEELRLRMADLEKRLAESEEERSKLEKTCNVLIRAFREEEKIHYKTLNEKYEKFLEDCTVRRRRNDLILKSLCRIEDRARAVFARTERLRLLKDRYVSHLKLSDLRKDVATSLTWKTFPQTTTGDEVTSKSVHWKTPRLSDFLRDNKTREYSENLFSIRGKVDSSGYGTSSEKPSIEEEPLEVPKTALNRYNKFNEGTFSGGKSLDDDSRKTLEPLDKLDAKEMVSVSYNPSPARFFASEEQLETNKKNQDSEKVQVVVDRGNYYFSEEKPQVGDLKEATELREKGVVKHQESIEKLKKALSIEEEDERLIETNGTEEEMEEIEKDEIEANEKDSRKRSDDQRIPRSLIDNSNYESLLTSSPKIKSSQQMEKDQEKEIESEFKVENFDREYNPESLPMGLDGVDYQNETYPESYYEQPVHQHNYSSIASDVILEEDESEQELEDEGKKNETGSFGRIDSQQNMSERDNSRQLNYTTTGWAHSPGDHNSDEPSEKEIGENRGRIPDGEPPFKGSGDSDKHPDSSSEKSSRGKSSEKDKKTTHSNLIHLLESDSESFQIEHGDRVSGNEDSDFDFSFHQN